ncbi:hypothetical protein CB1_056579055 [Camelus ferus]|nr:hypothetical protein CB1_056579055 [Camelus ferus]
MKACHTLLRYAWQETSHNFDKDDSLPKKMEEELFETVQPEKKYSHSPKQSKLQKLCHQQFEYRDGQIISYAAPQLVLGVQGPNLRSGMEVVLVEKKADDSHQRWMHKEDSRTFHLVSNPDLVLAVSMTKARDEACGYPVIAQKYKPYNNGASNQKWNYMKNMKAFVAFHSTALDKEITAANYAGICTSTVIKEENIDQPGYYYLSPSEERTVLCLACGQSMRAEKGLKQLLPGLPFLCASASKTQKPFSRGPFKVINVAKADLSSHEAENTLSYYEECLLSLWMKTCAQVVSHSGMAVTHQKAVKIIAYKNGDGYRNGKLIVAGTFPMAHLSEVQELQSKRNSPIAPKCIALKQSSLYKQPNVKRVWTYLNGGRPEDGTYAWGKTISELLDYCSSRLKMAHPARTLYTPAGQPIHSWDDIERDMVICVSTGHGFVTQKGKKTFFPYLETEDCDRKANYLDIVRFNLIVNLNC